MNTFTYRGPCLRCKGTLAASTLHGIGFIHSSSIHLQHRNVAGAMCKGTRHSVYSMATDADSSTCTSSPNDGITRRI